MRELMIIGPLISKNVLGGGLLFMCPGSPEGRAARSVVISTLELLILGPWVLGERSLGSVQSFPRCSNSSDPLPTTGKCFYRTELGKEKPLSAHTGHNE